MQKTIITVIVLLIVVYGIYYVVANNSFGTSQTSTMTSTGTGDNGTPAASNDQNSGMPASTSDSSSTVTTTSKNVEVDIRNFAFTPSTLNIKTGTKVTWTNYDTAPHTVTSVSGGLLNPPKLATGQSFSFTFTKAGKSDYYCTVHPKMKATVVVTD